MAKIFCLPLRLTAPSVHRELFLDFASGFFRQRFWADIKPGGCEKGSCRAFLPVNYGQYNQIARYV